MPETRELTSGPPGVDEVAKARVVVADTRVAATGYLAALERSPFVDMANVAERERDVLRLVEYLRPDVVLLSLDLPNVDGLPLLRRLRDPGRHQPDVFLTARDPHLSDMLAAMRLGVVCCLRRPFVAGDLRQRFESWWVELRLASARGRGAGLAQSDLDRLLRASGTRTPPRTSPKGIAPGTLHLVATELQTASCELSVKDIAERCGLSGAAARRYLNRLVELEQVSLRQQYGSPGRPVGCYRWVS